MSPAFLLIPLAAVLAPLLAALVSRAVLVPLVVFEIVLGIGIGPAGLGWVTDTASVEIFSQLGLAMLFFMAGNEIDPSVLRGKSGVRAGSGWICSALLAVAVGALLADSPQAAAIIAIALTGTALGTITPMLRDSGLNRGPVGRAISAAGAMGEFAPLVAMSVFLSGRQPIVGMISLIVFVAIAALVFLMSAKTEQRWLQRMVSATLRTSGQFAIRFVILLLAALVSLAVALGIDFMLGGFTAGLLARVVLRNGDPEEMKVVEAKLESVAFGFFVPLFFVVTGVKFPLNSLLESPSLLLLVPVLSLAMLVVRGVPTFFAQEQGTSVSDRRTTALFVATTLPLVIAVTQIGTDAGVLDEGLAAAMVGGGMLTVLLFPMLALLGRNKDAPAVASDSAIAADGANGAVAENRAIGADELPEEIHE